LRESWIGKRDAATDSAATIAVFAGIFPFPGVKSLFQRHNVTFRASMNISGRAFWFSIREFAFTAMS
jgi:hypothetical protein